MTQQNPYQSSVPPNSTMSIVCLVCGILGLTLVPGVASVIAIITGNMAMKEIRASGGTVGGEGMARIGIVLGWIAVALAVVGVCCFLIAFAFPFILAPLGFMLEGAGYLSGIGPVG
ncbi:MAG TPA: DUF4190 domain-containing protein [Anaerolineales bacterium]|nr:DUF4190 domain-containing protein [Anaerolineales bacterium]